MTVSFEYRGLWIEYRESSIVCQLTFAPYSQSLSSIVYLVSRIEYCKSSITNRVPRIKYRVSTYICMVLYMGAQRYEMYLQVFNSTSHESAQRTNEIQIETQVSLSDHLQWTFIIKEICIFFFQINSWHSVGLTIKVELKMVSMHANFCL